MTSKKYETGEVVDLGKAIYKEKSSIWWNPQRTASLSS